MASEGTSSLPYGHRSLHKPTHVPFSPIRSGIVSSLRRALRALFVFLIFLSIHEADSQRSNQCDRDKEMRQFLRAGFVGQELDDNQQQRAGDDDCPDGA